MKTKLAVAAATLALVSMAAPAWADGSNVTTSTDKFTGVTSVELKKKIQGLLPSRQGVMAITLASMTSGNSTDIGIVVITHTASWLFIGGTDGVVLVDGRRIPVHFQEMTTWVGENSQIGFWAGIGFTAADGYVCNEGLKGSISKQDLDAIASSSDVEIKVGYAEFRFDKKALGWFKEFDDAVTIVAPVPTPILIPTPSPAPPPPVSTAALRQQFVNDVAANLKQRGKLGYVEFSGDILIMHAPEGSKEKFDIGLRDKNFLAGLDAMNINQIIYTDEKDLTLVWRRITPSVTSAAPGVQTPASVELPQESLGDVARRLRAQKEQREKEAAEKKDKP